MNIFKNIGVEGEKYGCKKDHLPQATLIHPIGQFSISLCLISPCLVTSQGSTLNTSFCPVSKKKERKVKSK